MINRKTIRIMIIGGTLMTVALAATAAQLSQDVINHCRNYITNPTKDAMQDKTVSAALSQCYQNNVCQNELSNTPNCSKIMNLWFSSTSVPKPNAPTQEMQSIEQKPKTTAPASTNGIPAEFHSTGIQQPAEPIQKTPSSSPAETTYSTPAATKQPEPTQTNPSNESNKPAKPTINWF